MKRQTYSERYPGRARLSSIVVAISLVALVWPWVPKITIVVEPSSSFATVFKGSGR